jgi:hypothetical protein
MLFALTHAAALGVLAALIYAGGYLVQSALPRLELLAFGTALTRMTLGAIAWIALLFALACVGAYRAPVVLPLAGVMLLLAAARGLRALQLSRGAGGLRLRLSLAGQGELRELVLRLLLWAVPSVWLLAVFFHTLSLHIGWDDNTYHLTLPKLYLAHGGFRRVPFNVYSNWPHATELLFGLTLMLQDHVLAKLVHTLFLALLVWAVYRICRQHTGRCAALVACLLLLGNDVVLFEAERAYIDIAFALFFVVAIAWADEYLRSKRISALVMSGLCCGALAATKLSGILGLVCVGAVLLAFHEPFLPREGKRLVRIGAALKLPALLLAVPWYLKSYLYTGNPVYPFLYEQLGGREWNAALGRQFYEWQHSMGMGRSLHDYLALPARVVLDGAHGYARFDGQVGRYWLVAVPLSLLVALVAKQGRSYLLAAVVYFVFWALSSQQTRFLIAVLPALAIAAAMTCDALASLPGAKTARVVLHVLFVFGACYAVEPAFQASVERAVSEARALAEHGPGTRAEVVPEGYAFINAHTPKNAKVMLLNTNHGFFLQREYIADSFFEASQMNSVISEAHTQEQLGSTLAELGLTHIYLWRADWGIPYPKLLWRFLRNPRFTRLAYQCPQAACSLYELQPTK